MDNSNCNNRGVVNRTRSTPAFAQTLMRFVCALLCLAAFSATGGEPTVDPLPPVAEILQGRVFPSKFERDVFFLRQVREKYRQHWPALLEANINTNEYVVAASKLLRFIDELGVAAEGTDDSVAVTHLAPVVADPAYYANTNGYYPDVIRSAAQALIKIGPAGRHSLAGAFTQEHYRTDSVSLEDLAVTIARQRVDSPDLARVLTATAFEFSTADGGSFPRCTTVTVKSLLAIPGGVECVRTNLVPERVLKDPLRFQAAIAGLAAQPELKTQLEQIAHAAQEKLSVLTNSPGAYRDAVTELQNEIRRTLTSFAYGLTGQHTKTENAK
jgi:hypothetical protein